MDERLRYTFESVAHKPSEFGGERWFNWNPLRDGLRVAGLVVVRLTEQYSKPSSSGNIELAFILDNDKEYLLGIETIEKNQGYVFKLNSPIVPLFIRAVQRKSSFE